MYELTTVLTQLYEGLDMMEAAPELNPIEGEEEWMLDCPFCGQHDARVYKNNIGYIECQRRVDCGRSMTLYRFLRDRRGLPGEGVLKTLADIGLHLLELDPGALERCEEEQSRIRLLEEAEDFFVAELWSDRGTSVREYLTGTWKFTDDEIRGMRLGMFTSRERLSEHLRQRCLYTETDERNLGFDLEQFGRSHVLTMPYRDALGNMKGFAVMAVEPAYEDGRRYLWTNKRDTFFNLHEAREQVSVIMVGDPLTALTASARGLRAIVATGRSGASRAQLETAIPHALMDFVLCLAGDKKNSDEISRAIDRMRSDQNGLPYVMELPGGYRDLGEFLREHDVDEVTSLYTKALRDGYGVAWKTRMILDKYPKERYGEGGLPLALEEIKAFQSRLTDPLDKELVANITRQVKGSKTAVLEESIASYNELRHRRQLHQRLQEISRIIRRGRSGRPEDVLKTVFRLAKDLSVRQEREKPLFFPQTFREFLEEMFNEEQTRLPEDLFFGFPLKKFSKLAKEIDGVQPGLYVIAGHTGVGKTALMINLLLDLLESDPATRALYGTFDDDKAAVRRRLMSIQSEIPLNEIQKHPTSSFLYAKKKKAHNQLVKYASQEKLLVKDLSNINDLDDLELEIRQRASEDLAVFIDGLQVLPDGNTDQKNSDKATRIRKLVDIYRLPIFCAVELATPAGILRGPSLSPSDSVETGDFRNAADVIMVISKGAETNSGRGPDDPIPLTLQFNKNRLSGFTGCIQLEFIKNTGIIAER